MKMMNISAVMFPPRPVGAISEKKRTNLSQKGQETGVANLANAQYFRRILLKRKEP
jgi:hypothetical protein